LNKNSLSHSLRTTKLTAVRSALVAASTVQCPSDESRGAQPTPGKLLQQSLPLLPRHAHPASPILFQYFVLHCYDLTSMTFSASGAPVDAYGAPMPKNLSTADADLAKPSAAKKAVRMVRMTLADET
jgi:Tfp pilus assembly protein FimT